MVGTAHSVSSTGYSLPSPSSSRVDLCSVSPATDSMRLERRPGKPDGVFLWLFLSTVIAGFIIAGSLLLLAIRLSHRGVALGTVEGVPRQPSGATTEGPGRLPAHSFRRPGHNCPGLLYTTERSLGVLCSLPFIHWVLRNPFRPRYGNHGELFWVGICPQETRPRGSPGHLL